jgi:hypothetical protein
LNDVFTQSTGSPFDSTIIRSMTRDGHEGSPWEIMSFVPSAMTIAVGFFAAARRRLTSAYDSLVLRPRLWSIVTDVQVRRDVNRLPRFPNTLEPSIRLSPMTTSAP